MFLFPTKKQVKKELKKIADSFMKRDEAIQKSRADIEEIKENLVSKKEIELMIKESMLKLHELREVGPRTTRSKQRKRADNMLDKAEIMSEIGSMLQKGLSTTEAFNQIVKVRGLCKSTCFYAYLKKVRKLAPRTSRSSYAK